MRISEQEYRDIIARRPVPRAGVPYERAAGVEARRELSGAHGAILEPVGAKRRGRMNRLEERYAREVLEARKAASEVARYEFEALKFRLADGAYYCPDFAVWLASGALELHETKGFWREASRVRIKVAADRYPFLFVAVRRIKGEWVYEQIGG